ncbi:LysR family transcriptional regulator [Polycladidibacter stylochi]|uniref:LysR family transcriptional regulator n=1 Tax=Polycladidibacter stylochi TaxID=1807766 RepID=UPI00082D1FA2|nr:LysR family transcriptional regulator [Pseudovibrio stylochi]
MDLAELRDFVAVARAGSFAAAATATCVPRSTLSKRVQMLEAALELRLIERNTRKLRLTQDGELLLERAARLIAEADDLERLMRDRNEEPRGRLRVSVPVMFGQEMMGQIAAAYTQKWPETEIDVVLTDRRSDLIEEDFDCAIRIGPLKDSNNIARCLAWSRTVLVASPRLAAGLDLQSGLDAFSAWPTIAFAPAGTPLPWTLENQTRQIELSPKSAITFANMHAVRAAAIAGGGVALIPAFLVYEALADGRLVQLLTDWRGPASSINIVYPSRRHPSARLRAFIDLLASELKSSPWGAPEGATNLT